MGKIHRVLRVQTVHHNPQVPVLGRQRQRAVPRPVIGPAIAVGLHLPGMAHIHLRRHIQGGLHDMLLISRRERPEIHRSGKLGVPVLVQVQIHMPLIALGFPVLQRLPLRRLQKRLILRLRPVIPQRKGNVGQGRPVQVPPVVCNVQ